MNFSLKSSNVYSVVAVILSTALASAWVADMGLASAHWIVRLFILAGCLVLSAVAVTLLIFRTSSTQRSVQKYVTLLCQLEPHQLANNDIRPDTTPSLRRNCAWDDVFNQLREKFSAYAEKLQEAENARARAEVRARSTVSQRQQFADILSGLSDPVLAIDHFDEVVLANESAQELLDVRIENDEQRALKRLVHCEELIDLLSDTRQRKAPAHRTGELRLEDEDGQPTWFQATVKTFATGGEDCVPGEDTPHGAVAVLRDVSTQKAMQKRHAEFVSAVSHEMKTPLSGIKAYVELLADGEAEDEETREEFLDVINGQADRLQRLIDNLLNIARIEAGVVGVNKVPQSLNEILEEALAVVQPSAEAKQITLKGDLSPMYLGVLADRDMLLQSAINLLSNAIKYTPDEGRVTLRSRMQEDAALFEVEDTGVGLNEEDQDMVFQKFYRVKKDKNMAAGTGLGLPLAKHIAEDVHGGQLTVQSELGKGSTFTIIMPSAQKMTQASA